MADIWNTALAIVTSLGGGALIVFAFSSWLGKVWANRILEQDRTKYQAAIEGLKSEITKKIHEHNVAVSRIDAQQAEAIQRLYVAFVQWFEACLDIRAPKDIIDKHPEKARTVYANWGRVLHAKAEAIEKLSVLAAIYLSPETHKIVVRCGYTASMLSVDYCDAVINSRPETPEQVRDVLVSARAKLEDGYKAGFEPAQQALIAEFRRVLDPRLKLDEC